MSDDTMKPPDTVSETDLVPKDWVGGVEMSVAAWGMREYSSGRKSGLAQGALMAIAHLQKMAADAFVRKRDEEARFLRSAADEIRDLAAKSQ